MEIAFNPKNRHNDRPRNRVVWSGAIQRQESDDDCKLGINYMAGPVFVASIDHKFKNSFVEE